jgi:hypothetical protein
MNYIIDGYLNIFLNLSQKEKGLKLNTALALLWRNYS